MLLWHRPELWIGVHDDHESLDAIRQRTQRYDQFTRRIRSAQYRLRVLGQDLSAQLVFRLRVLHYYMEDIGD